jgi:hypothetical protein
MVKSEVFPGITEVGENETEVPVGIESTLKLTRELNPLVVVTKTVYVLLVC